MPNSIAQKSGGKWTLIREILALAEEIGDCEGLDEFAATRRASAAISELLSYARAWDEAAAGRVAVWQEDVAVWQEEVGV